MDIFLKRVILFILSWSFLSAAMAWQPRAIIVFGDSISDNGNKYKLYHIPVSPPYWHGRYSNGPVWTEILAYRLNLIKDPQKNPNYPRTELFQDYAFGQSVVLESNLSPRDKTKTLLAQVNEYLKQAPSANLQNTLVILWDGANDFKAPHCINDPFACVKEMIHLHSRIVMSLYDKGIRHFLFLTIPNVTITPEAQFGLDDRGRQEIAELIKYYNHSLIQSVEYLNFLKEDAHFMISDSNIFIENAKHNFSNPFKLACYDNKGIYDRTMGTICPEDTQANYFFWDWTHTTETVHHLLADHIYEQLQLLPWEDKPSPQPEVQKTTTEAPID